jgi:hypothetical protein
MPLLCWAHWPPVAAISIDTYAKNAIKMMAPSAQNTCATGINGHVVFAIKNAAEVGALCRHRTDIFLSSNGWTLAISIARRVPCTALIKT